VGERGWKAAIRGGIGINQRVTMENNMFSLLMREYGW